MSLAALEREPDPRNCPSTELRSSVRQPIGATCMARDLPLRAAGACHPAASGWCSGPGCFRARLGHDAFNVAYTSEGILIKQESLKRINYCQLWQREGLQLHCYMSCLGCKRPNPSTRGVERAQDHTIPRYCQRDVARITQSWEFQVSVAITLSQRPQASKLDLPNHLLIVPRYCFAGMPCARRLSRRARCLSGCSDHCKARSSALLQLLQ